MPSERSIEARVTATQCRCVYKLAKGIVAAAVRLRQQRKRQSRRETQYRGLTGKETPEGGGSAPRGDMPGIYRIP